MSTDRVRTLGFTAALAALRERDKGDDMVTSFGLRLVDRYSCQRITVPCRGDRCLHHECFDLNSYVAQNRGELLARCPVCSQPTQAKELHLDELVVRLLSAEPDQEVVTIGADGCYMAQQPAEKRPPQHESLRTYHSPSAARSR